MARVRPPVIGCMGEKLSNSRKRSEKVQFCVMLGFFFRKISNTNFHLRLFWSRALGENAVGNSAIYF